MKLTLSSDVQLWNSTALRELVGRRDPAATLQARQTSPAIRPRSKLEILAAAIPRLVRVAVPLNPGNPSTERVFNGVQVESQAMGLKPFAAAAQTLAEIEEAFALMTREKAQAFFVLADRQITELAAKAKLPAIYNSREYVEAWGA